MNNKIIVKIPNTTNIQRKQMIAWCRENLPWREWNFGTTGSAGLGGVTAVFRFSDASTAMLFRLIYEP